MQMIVRVGWTSGFNESLILQAQQMIIIYLVSAKVMESRRSRKSSRRRADGPQHAERPASYDSSSSEEGHLSLNRGDLLGNYCVLQHISDGTFGRVVEATLGQKRYAIKVIRAVHRYICTAKQEQKILQAVNRLDRESKVGVVRFVEGFEEGRNYCMVFERLGSSLYEVLKLNGYVGYPIHFVQKFARQLLETLGFMHEHRLTHTDLKPENICLVDSKLVQVKKGRSDGQYFLPHSSRVKVIDFGGATFEHQHHSRIINTRQYRAPEVILHSCPWSTPSDIWGVACALFFPVSSNLQHLAMIDIAAGPFPSHMVAASEEFRRFFKAEPGSEFSELNWPRSKGKELNSLQKFQTLNRLIPSELREFKSLVKQMLRIDPQQRPSCSQLLKHPFFQVQY